VAAIRSVLAVPGFLLIALLQHQRQHRAQTVFTSRSIVVAMAAGSLCYYLGSLANFYALTLIQANVERALLFSYPAMVVAMQAFAQGRWPSLGILMSLCATTAGVVLVTGALDQALTPQELEGVAWVLFCSMTIAIYFMVSGRLTTTMGAANFTVIAMTTAGALFLIHFLMEVDTVDLTEFAAASAATMIGLVVFATILPLFCMAEGVRRIGASRAALVSTLGPPATAAMAYVLYRETLSASQLLGTCMVVLAVALLELRGHKKG